VVEKVLNVVLLVVAFDGTLVVVVVFCVVVVVDVVPFSYFDLSLFNEGEMLYFFEEFKLISCEPKYFDEGFLYAGASAGAS